MVNYGFQIDFESILEIFEGISKSYLNCSNMNMLGYGKRVRNVELEI